MTYAYTRKRNFLLLFPSSNLHLGLGTDNEALGLGFEPQGWDNVVGAGFCASKLEFGLQGQNWAPRLGFGFQGWDLALKTGNWASWLGIGPQGWDLGLKDGIWASWLGGRGTVPHICESVGHQPLQDCCPKAIKVFGQWQFGKDSVNSGKAMWHGLMNRPTNIVGTATRARYQ